MGDEQIGTTFEHHQQQAFENALVSCMNYFRLVHRQKDDEIAYLRQRIEFLEAEIERLSQPATP
jgi:cell division protein FtsB